MNVRKTKWSISGSGYSIKTDDDAGSIVASYNGPCNPLNGKAFEEWIDNAEYICEIHNERLNEKIDVNERE